MAEKGVRDRQAEVVEDVPSARALYEEHRVQRTAFEISRDITEVLSGRRAKVGAERRNDEALVSSEQGLFPQVLAIVERFVAERVTPAAAARIEEIASARYRDIILDRLLTAIEADEGEAALLPRIDRHRPIGSTAEVQFRTNKPTKATTKSHLSHVVLDSLVWEGAAAFHLEQALRARLRQERSA
jgi:type III restriction enzyme